MRKTIILILFVIILAGLAVLGFRKFKPATVLAPVTTIQTGLVVNTPKPNDLISSPLIITGFVNGDGWIGFEGQVGVVSLYDSAEKLLAVKPLVAVTDWMTSTINFAVDLEFDATTGSGKLIFRNENPSGMPERDRQFVLPVKF